MQDVGEGRGRRGNQPAGGKADGDWHDRGPLPVPNPSQQHPSAARSGSEAGQISSTHVGMVSPGRLSEDRSAPRGSAEGSVRGTGGNRGGDGRRDGRREGRSRGSEKQPERGQRPGDAGQGGRGQESKPGSGQIATPPSRRRRQVHGKHDTGGCRDSESAAGGYVRARKRLGSSQPREYHRLPLSGPVNGKYSEGYTIPCCIPVQQLSSS